MRIDKYNGNRKIAIIGAGYVGSSVAYAIALKDIAREIVLIDINNEKTKGEALDIRHGLSNIGTSDLYGGDYCDCKDCDLIIITAGRGRKNGESRLDLISDNLNIMYSVVEKIKKYYTRGVILVISNPVDILTMKVTEWMGLSDGKVFGSGCVLDTSRFIRTLADYVNVGTGVINGYVVGEHGDLQIPIWSKVTIAGIDIKEYCEIEAIKWNDIVRNSLNDKTRTMGADIIRAKGRTHYGIATCVCYLADAIINQRPIITPVTSVLNKEYGVSGIALSVPSMVGPMGVHQRITEKWSDEEYAHFLQAVENEKAILKSL